MTPNNSAVDQITDSIWYARGNDSPWYGDLYEENFEIEDTEAVEEIEFYDEFETEENTSTPIESDEFPFADEDPNVKTYY